MNIQYSESESKYIINQKLINVNAFLKHSLAFLKNILASSKTISPCEIDLSQEREGRMSFVYLWYWYFFLALAV